MQKIGILCYPCGVTFIGMTAMNFCGECGKSVSKKIPHGDNLPRFVCDSCEAIHYHNPKIVAGCIPEWDGRLLLCRRAIEPKAGLWTYPAGFMEIGEGTEEAARRETFEEAGAHVTITRLHSVISLPHIGQVYLTFIGRLNAQEFSAGQESLDVRLFDKKDIPWDAIAFPVVKDALLRYMDDVGRGSFRLHVADLPDRLG